MYEGDELSSTTGTLAGGPGTALLPRPSSTQAQGVPKLAPSLRRAWGPCNSYQFRAMACETSWSRVPGRALQRVKCI